MVYLCPGGMNMLPQCFLLSNRSAIPSLKGQQHSDPCSSNCLCHYWPLNCSELEGYRYLLLHLGPPSPFSFEQEVLLAKSSFLLQFLIMKGNTFREGMCWECLAGVNTALRGEAGAVCWLGKVTQEEETITLGAGLPGTPLPDSSSLPGHRSVWDQPFWATGPEPQLGWNGAPGPWAGWTGPTWGWTGQPEALGTRAESAGHHAACSSISVKLNPHTWRIRKVEDSCGGPQSSWCYVPNTLLQQHLKAPEVSINVEFSNVYVPKVSTKQWAMLMR